MASGIKLVLTFKDNADKTVQYSYNHANPSATKANVLALATAMITNTAVLAKTLVSVTSIKQVTTAESEYDLDGYSLRTPTAPTIINGNPEPAETGDNQSVVVKKIE